MNVKAEKFDVLVADIEKSGNKWFTKDVIEGDEYNTVVYHGRLEIHGNSLPVFIVLDDSVFSYIRVAVTTTSITDAAIKKVLPKLNELNQQFKVTKYYVMMRTAIFTLIFLCHLQLKHLNQQYWLILC